MITQLLIRYQAVCERAGVAAEAAGMTVVFDAGQNSEANFTHLASAGLSWIGSVPASDCPDLLALPASRGASSMRTVRAAHRLRHPPQAYGAGRRAILTHSPELHQAQAAGFEGTTLAKPQELDGWPPRWPAADPPPPHKVESEITAITAKPWVRRVITWQLPGTSPETSA